VVYQEYHHPTYRQLHEPFMPSMAALDLILNEPPQNAAALMK
jgi:hypothetical protein